MVSNDPSPLRHLTSNALLSGITSLFYNNSSKCIQDKPVLNDTPLSKRSYDVYGNLHFAAIHLDNHPLGTDFDSLLWDYIEPDLVPSQPAHVEGVLAVGLWHPSEGFIELWRCLTILGIELLDFSYWAELTLSLPNLEIPYDSFASPVLPLDLHGTLRRLTWSGHSAQLVDSWLPFTLPLLQSLQILTLTCDISLHDCCYVLYHGTQLKSLTIETIRPTSVVDAVFPPLKFSSMNPRPCLEELVLASRENIGPLLTWFEFPSLCTLRLKLWYPTCHLGFQDVENFDWGQLKRVELFADLSIEDQNRIRSRCSPATEIQCHDPDLWADADWYFSF